jgi:N-methylhydantoinase A
VKELAAAFECAHEQMYGYVAEEEPIQAVTFRLEAVGAVRRAELREHPPATLDVSTAVVGRRDVWLAETRAVVPCPVYERERLGPGHELAGPAIVEQMDATTLVVPRQRARVDRYLNLVIDDG